MDKAKPISPIIAVSSIIVSMALTAMSSGIMFGYIPVKLASENFPPWVAGTMITAVAAGGILGCLFTSALVKQSGHARAFMALIALDALSFIAIAAGTFPYVWIAARIAYGFAVTGLFIVAQSWLNDATENQWRGRVIALFYMIYVLSVGFGSFSLRFAPLDGPVIPLMAVVTILLSIFPIALTRLPPPVPPESAAIAFRAVWQISPVGLMGLFCVGGLTMLVQGFSPIYVATLGFGKNDIGLMLFLMQFGMLVVQLPLGILSDNTDRRYIMVVAAVLVVGITIVIGSFSPSSFIVLVVLFAIWAGATESIYALSNAHANDRAEPQYYVSLSSTLLIAWSIAGFVVPAVVTMLTPIGGPKTFIWMACVIGTIYGVFVVARLSASAPVTDDESETFVPMTGQIPLGVELSSPEEQADFDQVVPDAERLQELNQQAEVLMGMISWPIDGEEEQPKKEPVDEA